MRLTKGRLGLYLMLIAFMAVSSHFLFPGRTGDEAGPEDASAGRLNPPVEVRELLLPAAKSLNKPLGVAVGGGGEILVADTGNNRVVVFSAAGRLLREFDGGPAPEKRFNYPVALAVDRKRNLVYVADFNNSRVEALSPRGEYRFALPRDNDLPAVGAIQPVALDVDNEGRLYISDVARHRILIFSSEGHLLAQFGERGQGPGQLQFANGLAVDPEGKEIFVADSNNGRIQVFTAGGTYVKSLERVMDRLLVTPRGLALDTSRDHLYIADTLAHQVYLYQLKFDRGARLGARDGEKRSFTFPNGLAVDREGRLYIADRDNNRVVIYAYPRQ